MDNRKLTYRSDIDGLRAIAVLAVIANHLPEAFLSSGFLGVDVFFVISGFVVSASLLRQNKATFSSFYSSFLSRRVKRLMPALITCVAITGVFVFLVDPFPQNSILTGVSALFGVANITLFNFELDYFSPSSKFNAFTHTWSLGVEEQFYVVFPMIIWLTFFGRKLRSTAVLAAVIALISLFSLAFFLWLYGVNQVAAYYLMPARFWELGAGVLVYLASSTFESARFGRGLAFLSSSALIGLLLCFFAPTDYASWSTAVAVGLTSLLLLNAGQSFSSRALSLQPVVYVGKISYSLYLWHWPVLSLGPLVLSSSWRVSALYIAMMSVAAVLSYHFVEKPLRVANWTRSKARDIATPFACSFVLSVAAILVLNIKEPSVEQDTVALHPEAFLPILGSGLPPQTCVVDDQRPLTPQTFEQCTIPPLPGSGMPMIWAMGDSHAGHLQGLLYELHKEKGFGVYLVESPGHPVPRSSGQEYAPNLVLFKLVMDNLKSGDIVLISRLFLNKESHIEMQSYIDPWIGRVSSLAKELAKLHVSLVITGPPPMFHFEDVRECDIAERKSCAVARAEIAPAINSVMDKLFALQKENENVLIFDIFSQVCPPVEETCYPDDGNRFLFRDQDHFNSLGSKRLSEPFIDFLRASGVLMR